MSESPLLQNPYASPAEENASEITLAERQRLLEIWHMHQRTEGAITGLSIFCVLGGIMAMVIGVIFMAITLIGFSASDAEWTLGFFGLFMATVAIYLFVLAYTLNKRTPEARDRAVWMAAFLLLLFPLGTVYGFYALMILNSRQAKMVFSPEYEEILRRVDDRTAFRFTPRLILWGFILFLMIFFGVGVMRGCTKTFLLDSVLPAQTDLREEIRKANNPAPVPRMLPPDEK